MRVAAQTAHRPSKPVYQTCFVALMVQKRALRRMEQWDNCCAPKRATQRAHLRNNYAHVPALLLAPADGVLEPLDARWARAAHF